MGRMMIALLLLLQSAAGEDWPCFRGAGGQGHSAETGLPLEWDAAKGVLWKTPVPGEGWSSPVVRGDRVYLTCATEGGVQCRVLAFDRSSGKLLWNTHVFDQVPSRKEGKNSHASSTPVAGADRVYAVFGGGGVAAVGLDGAVAWTNTDVKFYSRHGLGASPVLVDGLLIMPYDGSQKVDVAGNYPKVSDEERTGWQIPWEKAEIAALDAGSGKRVWTGKRGKSRIAHATPLIYDEGGAKRLLSLAGDVVQSFDPKTGELKWTAPAQGEGLVPSPVIADGVIFASSGYEKTTLRAVKFGGEILWEQKKGVPTQPSLLYVKPFLYGITDNGVAGCFDPATGEIVWQNRLSDKGGWSASPVYADGRIYALSEAGETVVFAPGREFKILARNALGEKTQASLAVSRGVFFVRTEKHLWAIGR
jgi:outer membrane protein assembly factor BamB